LLKPETTNYPEETEKYAQYFNLMSNELLKTSESTFDIIEVDFVRIKEIYYIYIIPFKFRFH